MSGDQNTSRLESVPSQVINARRTESLDAPHIIKLAQQTTSELFGRVDVVEIIEKAVLAITLNNEKDEILGHAAFYDYPNTKSIDQAEWVDWIRNNFDEVQKSSAFNTLFLHYFVARPGYANGCAKEIMRTAFTAIPDVHFIILMVPNGTFPDPSLSEIFQPLKRINSVGSEVTAFVCKRHDHVPVLHVRQARVEDNDDLTPIFNRQSDMLKSIYGDFFLAELIEAQDDEMQCLVVEAEGTACGFTSLNKNVNYDLLNECFELAPFHGLRKPHDEDDLVPPATPVPSPITVETRREDSIHSRESKTESPSLDKDETTLKTETSKLETSDKLKTSRQSSAASARGLLLFSLILFDTVVYSRASERKKGFALSEQRFRFVPTYKGEANAFTIQLFCIDEKYEMRSKDILSKAFSLFPHCDFCIITVPHLVPEFPLLHGFVRVTPRSPSTLSQELYVFHRSGLLKNFNVRTACTKDIHGVENLVKSIHCQSDLLDDFKQFRAARRDEDGKEIQAFVAECSEQIVGVCIVRREEDIEYIRSHYNIEDFIYFNHHRREDHGHLHHFALNPVFSHLSKHFLKEVLRLGHKTCLYYPLYPPYISHELTTKNTMISALNDLVPVRARRQVNYNIDILGENSPSDRVLKQTHPFALCHINRKLTLEPKVTINARIVVVGASDVGVAFLETLAYCPHLRFNNVTLISPHGFPGEIDPSLLQHPMLTKNYPTSKDEEIWSFLRTWISIVYGKMTGIDRTRKQVKVNSSFIVPYDHLIICTGQQYQVPCPTEASLEHGVTNKELPNSPDRRYKGSQPNNLYLVNDYYDSLTLQHAIQNKLMPSNNKILLYGNNIDTYTCIQSLLQYGITGDNILLVLPPQAYDVTCFNNKVIEDTVRKALNDNGIKIYEGFLLAEWTLNDDTDITSVSFTSDDEPLTLSCHAFFSLYKKAVDMDSFKAINDACLVYDGKLVVDSLFHTNDVSIRGAGTLTKYQRKYYGNKWSHANFNSKEIGIALATEILKLFDPTVEPEAYPREEQFNLIPLYRAPKIQVTMLPGGYNYLHVKKPGLDVPLEIQMANEDYGKELVTGEPDSEKGYFRLHVNLYNSIETITCLAKQEVTCSNLLCLYGLHEKYLNNLVSRFDEGLITDFYSYFKESWCVGLYHDRFSDLRDELRELLITSPEEGKETLEDQIRQLIDEEMSLNSKQHDELNEIYKLSGAKQAVETRLLNFLSYNYYHLPMYAKPGMV
ncbi:hypothetical protein LOTGIDRAFT_107567 [Lottia gigantea]|uniref:Cilia- and flagella-associated protein 61 N-terminal domain-containing protein n=1 Tax=Lottia gigantea TaxID=225164 RepID=V4B959_LOTGI|nr:hypothetical protein LOTGIDRAFT_107567 [Lottia gigantea]ESO85404.1 hypothetical protein LOTGIDRAFT_107567 [Lottia gigantea]